jgi:hypothetical protein
MIKQTFFALTILGLTACGGNPSIKNPDPLQQMAIEYSGENPPPQDVMQKFQFSMRDIGTQCPEVTWDTLAADLYVNHQFLKNQGINIPLLDFVQMAENVLEESSHEELTCPEVFDLIVTAALLERD